MLRRSISTALVSLLLAAGLTTAAPAQAQSVPYDSSIGHIQVPDQVRGGYCDYYRVNWRFHPPTPDWQVNGKIRSPRGFGIASLFWDSGSPTNLGRRRGHMRIQLCGSSVRPGRYKVLMTMTYNLDARTTKTVRQHPTYFRLLRRP